MHYVHLLVAEAFIGPKPEGQQTRHRDGNPDNNQATNLHYGTRGDNQRDSVEHGTHNMARKTECRNGHPYSEGNTYVVFNKGSYERRCRICTSATRRRYLDRRG
jgi:hypothetical protein